MNEQNYISQHLAPEDIRPGQYVAVMHVVVEFIPFGAMNSSWQSVTPQRVQVMPWGKSLPVKVVDVCLPFVLVQDTKGKHRTIDVRRYRLARVAARFGRLVFEQIKADRKRERDEDNESDAKAGAGKAGEESDG